VQKLNFFSSKPESTSNLVSLRLGRWGLEKFIPMFAFMTWDPSIGIGYFNYDINSIENKWTLQFSIF